MKRVFSIILSIGCFASLWAKELKYPVSEIPSALRENAHTVYRIYQQNVEILSPGEARVSVLEVRTILNKNGDEDARFMELYNPLNKIDNLKGRMFNEFGEQTKKFGYDDIIDRSYITGYSMFDDNRVKAIQPQVSGYPYTVEYSYDLVLKQTLFLPSWFHDTENRSYQQSSFQVTAPAGFVLKYKEYNLPKGVEKSTAGGKDLYKWSLQSLKATSDEPWSSAFAVDVPMVKIVSESFAVGASSGKAASWNTLGQWAQTLINGKDELPADTKAKIQQLTADCKTDFEKVKKVYEYMQAKTRYVSIQVGIGGWQPFDASTVDRLSYGDCKALSNYTRSLLSAAGIRSFYTLVRAGESSHAIDAAFSSSQFNHAFVCVPLKSDTVWLECTSQRLPCGFNSDFTDDRDVLIINGDSSRLVHTRIYGAKENCVKRRADVTFADEDGGQARVVASYIGLASNEVSSVSHADAADQLKYTTQQIKLPSFSLTSFNYAEQRGRTPVCAQQLDLTFSNYSKKMGEDLLLTLNFMNRQTDIPDKVRNRKTEMCIRRDQMEVDTVVYQLPKGWEVSSVPDKAEIATKFGKYTATVHLDGRKLTYVRSFELYKGVFPAAAYEDFRTFFEDVAAQDNAFVSLRKQAKSGA